MILVLGGGLWGSLVVEAGGPGEREDFSSVGPYICSGVVILFSISK
jgi:hypothetical protein